MQEPYATFDTFTVGENFAPGEDPLTPPPQAPILARLPRLVVGDQKNNRFDRPETGLIGVHGPATSAPAAASSIRGGDNPAATIRFDTVLTNDGYVEADHVEADHAEADHAEADHVETDHAETDRPVAARDQALSMLEEAAPKTRTAPPSRAPALYPATEFDSWLLNLEATVMPYSRWIALAAVIAALGLTMILLRSNAPAAISDAPLPSNQVGNLVSEETFAVAREANSLSTDSAIDTGKGLQSLGSPSKIITNTFATTAMGPAGHEVAQPQARLVHQLQPIEPYRVSTTAERIEVALQPPADGYPRTAANGPVSPATSNGSTLR